MINLFEKIDNSGQVLDQTSLFVFISGEYYLHLSNPSRQIAPG